MPMKEKSYTLPIITISIAIPMAVAFLIFGLRTKVNFGFNTSSLPLFHAILNSTTAILLLASLYFIKNKRIRAHRRANLTAVVLSSIFLISYVIYHSSNPSVKYGDLNHDGLLSMEEKLQAGNLRYVYYFILSSHIILSGIIIPFVLFTLQRAFPGTIYSPQKTGPLHLADVVLCGCIGCNCVCDDKPFLRLTLNA